MTETLNRLLQTLRFDREAYVWMDLNDKATGDAIILVVVTRFLVILGVGTPLLGLVNVSGVAFLGFALLDAVVFWLVYAGLVYAAAKYLFKGEGSYATVLRFVGFGYPTTLLMIVTFRVISNGTLAFLAGSAWLLAIVAQGLRYVFDLSPEKAIGSALLGLVAWIIVQAILGSIGF